MTVKQERIQCETHSNLEQQILSLTVAAEARDDRCY